MQKRELPEGWESCTLLSAVGGDEQLIVSGPFGSNLKVEHYCDQGVPIVRLQNIGNGEFLNKDIKYISQEKAKELQYHSFQSGDLILTKLGEPIGKTCLIPDYLGNGIVVSDVVRIRNGNSDLSSKYLMYLLNSTIVSNQLNNRVFGTTRQRVNLDDVRELKIPLPPLPVQRRIVEILEQADALRHLRTEADAETQKLLQSVFYEMFGDPVRNEKGWELVKLKEICEEVTVGIVVKPASYYVKDGVPAFRSLNIKEDALNLDNLVHISPDDNNTVLSKSKLKTGDILVVRTGNPGTSCVVPVDFNGANCIDLIIIRPNRDRINSQYLSKFLNSEYGKAQSLASNTGLAQQHLNVRNIREMIIPLPPLHLQQQFSYIKENIERNRDVQAKSKQEIERLFEGLMTVAFTGELN